MNCIHKIVLCSAIVIGSHSFAMDVEQARITIVDLNDGQTIQSVIGSDPVNLALFGSIPRYSYFAQYRQTVRECSTALIDYYELAVSRAKKPKAPYYKAKNKPHRLKGVQKQISALFREEDQSLNLSPLRKLSTLTNKQCMELFFRAGFTRDMLKENVSTLLATTARCFESQRVNRKMQTCLVHVFVPSYFSDLASEQDIPSPHDLHCFLVEAAFHYERLYQEMDCPFNLCILIPPISYITCLLEKPADSKAEANTNLVLREVLSRINPQSQCTLIDQGRNLEKMVCLLQARAVQHIAGQKLMLPPRDGFDYKTGKPKKKETHTFNPYLLISQIDKNTGDKKEHNYKISPLFNQQLIAFLQQIQFEGNSHE